MDEELKIKILDLLDRHRIMTIATLRADGWPQATTRGLRERRASSVWSDSQKAYNLGKMIESLMAIAGLSIAGHATVVGDRAEVEKILRMLSLRYPKQELPMPRPEVFVCFL
jgi:hypothetical protein